jgi:hypothetical protein
VWDHGAHSNRARSLRAVRIYDSPEVKEAWKTDAPEENIWLRMLLKAEIC